MRSSVLPSVLVLVLLAGCGPRPEERENQVTNPTSGSAASGTKVPATRPAATAKVWFLPAALEDCSPATKQVTTIHWDATKSGAKTVDVKVISDSQVETTFATSGLVGSKVSGPWMKPGSTIIVRDHMTGVELGRASVAATSCTN